jgi:hypothetical protein
MIALAAKPETTFIAGVHKKLDKRVYHMKNNNQYTGGIADVWYSGHAADLWVEYKYLPRTPSRAPLDPMRLLSPLQQAWLRDRRMENRNVAVIIGCPDGGVVLMDRLWELELTVKQFTTLLRSKEELAEWIFTQVG